MRRRSAYPLTVSPLSVSPPTRLERTTTMSDLIVSRLIQTYQKPVEVKPVLPAPKAPKAKTLASPPPEPKAKPTEKLVLSSAFPTAGTYTAEKFLALIRGIVTEPAIYRVSKTAASSAMPDPSVVPNPKHANIAAPERGAGRLALIHAIAGYVGFDPNIDLAIQDREARAKAFREIRGIKVAPATTVAGYRSVTPGQCKPDAKRKADLLAREKMAAEDLIEAVKSGAEVKVQECRDLLAVLQHEIRNLA